MAEGQKAHVTVQQAGEMLGLSKNALYAKRWDKFATRVGGKRMFPTARLEEMRAMLTTRAGKKLKKVARAKRKAPKKPARKRGAGPGAAADVGAQIASLVEAEVQKRLAAERAEIVAALKKLIATVEG